MLAALRLKQWYSGWVLQTSWLPTAPAHCTECPKRFEWIQRPTVSWRFSRSASATGAIRARAATQRAAALILTDLRLPAASHTARHALAVMFGLTINHHTHAGNTMMKRQGMAR